MNCYVFVFRFLLALLLGMWQMLVYAGLRVRVHVQACWMVKLSLNIKVNFMNIFGHCLAFYRG